jgi:putative membrane protein insertion efficiency factor
MSAARTVLVQVARGLRRLPVLALTLVVRGYQLFVSPLLGPRCRFYPSCSAYALTALQRHGAVRGSWLAVRRLGRCHPWNPGGVDHVPAAAAHPDSTRGAVSTASPSGSFSASTDPSAAVPASFPVAPAAGPHSADDPALRGRIVA